MYFSHSSQNSKLSVQARQPGLGPLLLLAGHSLSSHSQGSSSQHTWRHHQGTWYSLSHTLERKWPGWGVKDGAAEGASRTAWKPPNQPLTPAAGRTPHPLFLPVWGVCARTYCPTPPGSIPRTWVCGQAVTHLEPWSLVVFHAKPQRRKPRLRRMAHLSHSREGVATDLCLPVRYTCVYG